MEQYEPEELTPETFRPFILRLSRDLRKAAQNLPAQQARILVDTYYNIQDTRKRLISQIFMVSYYWKLHDIADDFDKLIDVFIAAERDIEDLDDPEVLAEIREDPQACLPVRRAAKAYARAVVDKLQPCPAIGDFLPAMRHLIVSLEDFARKGLEDAVPRTKTGEWLSGLFGIGPVLTVGLLAHLDVTKAPHMSSFRKFAGIGGTLVWEKGQKRPHNAELKTLLWKVADSFVKFRNFEKSELYGGVYDNWKGIYEQRNANGFYREKALAYLETHNIRNRMIRAIYAGGQYAPGHLDKMARRKAVSMFLGHLYEVMYYEQYGRHCQRDYVQDYLGHEDRVPCPHWPWPNDPPRYQQSQ